MNTKTKNLFLEKSKISFSDRQRKYNQLPIIYWFPGLSGAEKTTIASEFEFRLFEKGHFIIHIDADDVRKNLNNDLGFTISERLENIRRAAAVSRIMQDAGMICPCIVYHTHRRKPFDCQASCKKKPLC